MFVGGGGGEEEVCLWERETERREVFVRGREVFIGGFVNSTPHFARITRAIFLARGSSCSVSVCSLQNSHRPARMSCSARCLTRHFFLIH